MKLELNKMLYKNIKKILTTTIYCDILQLIINLRVGFPGLKISSSVRDVVIVI